MQTPDQIRTMYRRLGAASITVSGGVVPALVDITDRTAYDVVTVGDYELRYLTEDAQIDEGDEVSVSSGVYAGTYAAAERPRRLNAYESAVQMVRV